MTLMTTVFEAANAVIPVVTLEDVAAASGLADVFADAGFGVLEITLRTPAGVAAITSLRQTHPHLLVGAGTVWTEAQAETAFNAGASFLVSPGFSNPVHQFCRGRKIPYLPGVATVTEAMMALDLGYEHLKLFPANTVGGPAFLKALHAVAPELLFCPTGGVNLANLASYLELPNVAAVGGSWLAPNELVSAAQWTELRVLATQASACVDQLAG